MFHTQVLEKIEALVSHIFENRAVYELMWKNWARQATYDNIIWHMCFDCWIIEATNTYSEYAILIAFPRQQWGRERAKVVGLYAHCLPCFSWYSPCIGKVAHHRPRGKNTRKLISLFIIWINFSTRPPKCGSGVLPIRGNVRWITVTVQILLRVCATIINGTVRNSCDCIVVG
jgi:hypothetical protein